MTSSTGFIAPGWEPVRDAFEHNFSSDLEVGAACSVYHRSVEVVRLAAGLTAPAADATPYRDDTLQLVFSTTKGIAAIALAICVDRGLLSYDDRVADHWPEFAANGKGSITITQLVSHQAGLFTVDGTPTLEQALDWSWITARLAEQRPLWEPGTGHGYHALTFGWLVGELVRRVDPAHRPIGRFVEEEISGPVNAEFWIGLPEQYDGRVAPLVAPELPTDPGMLALIEQFLGPNTNAGRALTLNGAFAGEGTVDAALFDTRAVRGAEIPAANGIGTAAGLARIYAAVIDEVDGVRLVSPATLERARTVVTPTGEGDACLIMPTTFGLGFMTSGTFSPFAGPGSFGHPGLGGSVAFAHPERELAFAYVMNRMADNLSGDVRAQRIIQAAARCADATR